MVRAVRRAVWRCLLTASGVVCVTMVGMTSTQESSADSLDSCKHVSFDIKVEIFC